MYVVTFVEKIVNCTCAFLRYLIGIDHRLVKLAMSHFKAFFFVFVLLLRNRKEKNRIEKKIPLPMSHQTSMSVQQFKQTLKILTLPFKKNYEKETFYNVATDCHTQDSFYVVIMIYFYLVSKF